jgi:RHS repeat-associated protein
MTDRWEYWPYGEVVTHTGSSVTPLTFLGVLGYSQDIVGKLTYVRARHLRVDLARWLSVDSLWPKQDSYTYVSNSPIHAVDPSGRNPACIACAACLGLAAVGALLLCLTSPLGLGQCLVCFCQSNPLLCSLVMGGCLAACALCIPAIITQLGPILSGVGGTAGAGVAMVSRGCTSAGTDAYYGCMDLCYERICGKYGLNTPGWYACISLFEDECNLECIFYFN